MADKKRGPGRPAGSKNKKTNKETSKKGGTKAKQKAQEIQAKKRADKRVIDEIWAIIIIAIGAFLIVATFTNGAGQLGAIIDKGLKGLFGFMAYVLPFYLVVFGMLLFLRKTSHFNVKTIILLFITILMLCTMNSVRFIDEKIIDLSLKSIEAGYTTGQTLTSGGFFGMLLAKIFVMWLGKVGTWILTIVVMFICLLLIINTPISRFIEKISEKMEERRLIKEHAHLDNEDEADDYDISSDAHLGASNSWAKTQGTSKHSFFPIRKKEIKVVNSSIFDNENQEMNGDSGISQEAETSYNENDFQFVAPKIISMNDSENTEENEPTISTVDKNSVLKYMNDDSLFKNKTQNGDINNLLIENPFHEEGVFASSNTFEGERIDSDNFIDKNSQSAKLYEQEKPTKKELREAMLTEDDLNKKEVKLYNMPPINLLETNKSGSGQDKRGLESKAAKLEHTLRSFNVDAHVVKVVQGPTVTRYEIQPSVGVKVSKIVSLADDIALNLEAKSIRMEAPIPGKAAVGIEVENDCVTMVKLREVVDSSQFKNSKSKITFAVGKDIGGNPVTADLKSMPHMLIAGSTGSGKSVCVNSIIVSLLYKAKPDEVKLILIDPKVVELGNYNGIPHLLIPVVTDPTKAAAALNWAVSEMTDRYKKFAEEGVRDLESYNEYVTANGEKEKVMAQIVIIIDELADLMMAAPSQIEESICRLAQMARAAGMHLIVATQRPSVDVITGVIKANIPSRIAFAVSSQVDSRTILDMAGAEKLVGRGDMLFNPMGMGKPIRVQGTFISDSEVLKVIDFVKNQVEEDEATYNEDVISQIDKNNNLDINLETDEILPDAIELVVNSGQASISMIQRRFRVGYNRAARVMDMMEERGVVGPQEGSKPRQVLMSQMEWENLNRDEEDV